MGRAESSRCLWMHICCHCFGQSEISDLHLRGTSSPGPGIPGIEPGSFLKYLGSPRFLLGTPTHTTYQHHLRSSRNSEAQPIAAHLAGVVENVGWLDVVMNDPPAAHLAFFDPSIKLQLSSSDLAMLYLAIVDGGTAHGIASWQCYNRVPWLPTKAPHIQIPQATQDLNDDCLRLLSQDVSGHGMGVHMGGEFTELGVDQGPSPSPSWVRTSSSDGPKFHPHRAPRPKHKRGYPHEASLHDLIARHGVTQRNYP